MGRFADNYGPSKIGPTQVITVPASSGTPLLVTLVTPPAPGAPFVAASFALFISAGPNTFMRQGGSGVVVVATGAAADFLMPNTVVWRVDVESAAEAYLSVISSTTSTATLRVTRIDSISATGSP